MVEVSRRVVKSERELFYTEISLLRIKKSFKINVLIYNLISNNAKKVEKIALNICIYKKAVPLHRF